MSNILIATEVYKNYQNGPEVITRMLKKLESWMSDKGFDSVEQFRGKITQEYGDDPAVFERMQFMKHFSEIR